MTVKSIRRLLLAGVVVAASLVAFSLTNKPGAPSGASNIFHLRAPPFVGVARAEAGSLASLIEDEAGMSAWLDGSTTINLDDVRPLFRTIEVETADYIIGSVPVANYPESQDVHVYVDTDGWILAYYLKADPVGKIFDWRAYHDSGRLAISTKLENTVAWVALEAGVPFFSATHYHFRYPNATHLMLIVEWVGDGGGTDSCEVKIPGSYTYYERSWSLGNSPGGATARYRLDGALIREHGGGWATSQGTFTAAQLSPDQFHTIEVEITYSYQYAYGGLALVYRVP